MANNWEKDYLALCSNVAANGYKEPSRVGGTYALPGQSLRIEMPRGKFPLLTTRRMFYKPVFGELAAFLRGATRNGQFMKYGCNYWTANARAAHPHQGWKDKDLPLGPIYGAQWRKFNGDICYDQLADARKMIRENPSSRRIVVTAWNPLQTAYMALPPCHIMFQFHVMGKALHMTVYMRSVDLCLGLPSDVALYYALLVIMAHDTDLPVGSLTFSFGNAHVYTEHFKQLPEQLSRPVLEAPDYGVVSTNERGSPITSFIDQFTPSNILISNYEPAEKIAYALLA